MKRHIIAGAAAAAVLRHRRGSVLVVTSLLLLAFVEDRPRAQAVSRRDGRISIIVGESGDAGPTPRLVVMDADGTNAHVRLGWVFNASFSPDGRLIAYEPRTTTPEIRVVAADGGAGGRVLVRNGRDLDWSPTGETVAFVRDRHGCCANPAIWIEDLRSRKQRPVVRNAQEQDWSPEGEKPAFVRRSGVWVADVASKLTRRLIRNADKPRWSPDGERIAFARERGTESFVHIAHADGTAPRRLTRGDSAAWSPDGGELAIAQFRRLLRIRPDGSHARVVPAAKRGFWACRFIGWVR